MNFAFTTPHQQTRKYIVFISFLVFSTFFTSYSGNAQIDIKSKVDAQTYAEYSKAIDLFEKNINPNEVLTLFIPINYSLDRISSELYNSVFNVNDQNVASFLNNHIVQKELTDNFLRNKVIDNNTDHFETFKSNRVYHFVKNDTKVMLTDNQIFEANIEKSIKIEPGIIIFFINGVVKY